MIVAQNLLSKLKLIPIRNNRQSTAACLESLNLYIESLCQKHMKKTYSSDYIIGAVFRCELNFKSDSEVNQYCKCQLQLASSWLQSLINQIKTHGNFNHSGILKFKDHISNFLFDIKPFIEHLERKDNKDYVFFHGDKYYGQSAWQVFQESRALYWLKPKDKNLLSHRSSINLSIFTLRQSLELKFKNILGIQDIYDKEKISAKIKHDYIPEFLGRNLSELDINFDSINGVIKIYKWTNTTIHKGFIPYIWELDFALNYCSDLFIPDDPDPTGSWSLYSAVKINDYDKLISSFINEFCNDYSDKFWCFSFIKPEAVVKSKN